MRVVCSTSLVLVILMHLELALKTYLCVYQGGQLFTDDNRALHLVYFGLHCTTNIMTKELGVTVLLHVAPSL